MDPSKITPEQSEKACNIENTYAKAFFTEFRKRFKAKFGKDAKMDDSTLDEKTRASVYTSFNNDTDHELRDFAMRWPVITQYMCMGLFSQKFFKDAVKARLTVAQGTTSPLEVTSRMCQIRAKYYAWTLHSYAPRLNVKARNEARERVYKQLMDHEEKERKIQKEEAEKAQQDEIDQTRHDAKTTASRIAHGNITEEQREALIKKLAEALATKEASDMTKAAEEKAASEFVDSVVTNEVDDVKNE